MSSSKTYVSSQNKVKEFPPKEQAASEIKHSPYKYLGLMMMLYVTCLLATVVLTYKMVAFGPALLPGGVFIFPLTYFFGDVVAEVYGYSRSRQLIWSGLLCELIFCMSTGIIIHFPSPPFWHNQAAYDAVLGLAPRFFFANAIATVVGAFINIYAISKWKILMQGKYFWLRSLGSTSIGEAVFTATVASIAFIGVMPFHHVMKLMISMYFFKVIYALFAVWPASFLVFILKKKENVDVYDYNTNFNPFIFSLEDRVVNIEEYKASKL